MSYPAPFHRVVIIGSLYADVFNTTVSMIPTGGGTLPAATDELALDVANAVASWFQSTNSSPFNGIGITSQAKLTSVKVNRIGTDGLYMDADPHEFTVVTPIAGSAAITPAPQLSMVMTLRGANERARAGRGRMYFPPSEPVVLVGADGRISATAALNQAKGGLKLLSALNDVYLTAGINAVAGIASKVGAGAFQAVDHVSVGRVVDTMRSRRNKLDEDPQIWGTP